MKKCISLLITVLLCLSITACNIQITKSESSFADTPSQQPNESSSSLSARSSESETSPNSTPESILPEIGPSANSTSESDLSAEKIETMIRIYRDPSTGGPAWWSDAKPNGIDLYYSDGTIAHVPIASSGPGIYQTHTISLRKEAVVIAYFPDNSTNTISVISTKDKGQNWASSVLNVESAEKYSHYYLAFRDENKGILILHNSDEKDGLVYTTENTGATWNFAASFSNIDAIYTVTAENSYCIAGENQSYPIVLKSDDGLNWSEIILPLDTNEYVKGYSPYAAFLDNTGLAVVVASNAAEDMTWLYFSSEDDGKNWTLYKTGR